MKRLPFCGALLLVLGFGMASGQEAPTPPANAVVEASAPLRRQEEVLVISASKSEQALVDAPATVSVVSSEEIAKAPSTNVGDLLRSVPGTNVVQISARDVNITSRQATSTLPNSQLALLDGRSLYLDFFGIILWDFVPSDPAEIQQIEVVRGPASAVWGANALTGVVNILTKSPRHSAGTSATFSGGVFGRGAGDSVGQGAGQTLGLHLRHARVVDDRWSFKVSGGLSSSDAYARPTGQVPVDRHPLDPEQPTGGGTFAPFENQGTRQPKLDVRADQVVGAGLLSYSAGYAGTAGIIHSGIGPFDIQPGSYMAYGRLAYTQGPLKLAAFVNQVDADAPNLLSVDALTGQPVQLGFETRTYDLEAGRTFVIGRHHLVTLGGNVRHNTFDITIAPAAQDRTEMGAYVQEEAFVGRFRFAAGARLDKFGNLDRVVPSPRLMVMYKPREEHSLRLSFNRAFRAPAVLNNALDLTIQGVAFPLGAVCLLSPASCAQDPTLLTRSLGLGPRSIGSDVARTIAPTLDPLREESVTAYELAYTGTFDRRTTVGLALFVNETDNNINFVGDVAALSAVGLPLAYSAAYPPPGWPFPPALLDHPVLRSAVFEKVPATIAYLNLGPVRNRGLELSLDHHVLEGLRLSASYSWQDEPRALTPSPGQLEYPTSEMSVAARHRLGAGLSWERGRGFGAVQVQHVSRTYWNDILPQLGFDGYTDAYTLVNASVGARWAKGRATTVLKATNLLNQEIRQHIFGDIQKVAVGGELRLTF